MFALLVLFLRKQLAQGVPVRYHEGKELPQSSVVIEEGWLVNVGMRTDIRSFPGRPFAMPKDLRIFQLQFWSISKAAKEWGCSYQTARRWVLLHPELGVLVRVWSPRSPVPRWKLCVFAGQKKVSRSEGAAHFRSSAWQRSMANRRWQRQRAADQAAGARELPTPPYGRCKQPIPGTSFPNRVQDQRQQLHKQQLPADHKPLRGQIDVEEALRILDRPVRVKGW